MAITSANQLELLQTAEAVAREKMIEPGLVVEAMEESLARAAKSRYGAEMDIRVSIDRKTGKATFTRVRTVVEEEELENYQAEFTVEQAKEYMENPEVGQQFIEEVPPVELGRIAAQSAKQVILQKVREAERTSVRVRLFCAGTRRLAARLIARMIASAATSKTCAASSVGRRFSCPGLLLSSWRNCSRWKCRRFTKV